MSEATKQAETAMNQRETPDDLRREARYIPLNSASEYVIVNCADAWEMDRNALAAMIKEVEAAQANIERAEALAKEGWDWVDEFCDLAGTDVFGFEGKWLALEAALQGESDGS